MNLHKHDYDMEFPFERPLLPLYRCKHCGDVQTKMAAAMMKQGALSLRADPAKLRWFVGGRPGAWYVYERGRPTSSVGPYRYRVSAVMMRWALDT